MIWALAGVGAVLSVFAALFLAPARTTILVDTPSSTARADLHLLWGVGPRLASRALPREAAGNPLRVFNDPARIGYALMTPGIAEAAYHAVRRLSLLKPRLTEIEVGVNLTDAAQNMVVQTAVQAALAAAPAALRESVRVHKCAAPGAELIAKFELMASPLQLSSIWNQLKGARSAREFRKRLKRKPKPSKKAPREVRAA